MTRRLAFDVQGHRGARGLKPENTLPSFEAAFDLGISSVETDLHLTRDGVPVLIHDPILSETLCSRLPARSLVSRVTLAELRGYRVDRNPDPAGLSGQDPGVTPLARAFAEANGLDPYGVPTLAEFFAFASWYFGEPGRRAGKTPMQQRAARVRFDLELKRVPLRPETIGDGFDGTAAGLLERRVLEEVEKASVLERTRVRSFDHRSVRLIRHLQPRLETAVLIEYAAPVDPAQLLDAAVADVYCPGQHFVDGAIVRQIHAAGKRIIPWTVNDPDVWERLAGWGVDGLTTDYPDRLLAWLRERGIAVLGDE